MLKKILSLQHPIVKHLVKVRQNADYRWDHQSVFIEGIKVVHEVGLKCSIKHLIALDETLIPKGIKAKEIFIVSESVMQKISGMKTPEGIAAEIEMPKAILPEKMSRLIALEGISDPGNLGTLLRTALALGWEGVFLVGEEGCDPFNEKALRSARGATFSLHIGKGSWAQLEKIIDQNQLEPLAADLEGQNIDTISLPERLLLVLGNEARGLSETAEKVCKKITIPLPGPMESLNVAIAGGILMFALGKGRR